MSTPPYQQLARQFLDLWQKQMSSMMNDRDFIQTMLDTLQAMPTEFAGNHESRPASASHAASASEPGVERMAELDYRLRMCEQRLSKLEAKKRSTATRKPSSGKRSKARSKKPPGAASKRH